MNRHEIERKMADLDAERKKLLAELDASKRRTLVTCTSNCYGPGCGVRMQVGKLVYIQTKWHVPPSGCSAGDYWLNSEGQFDCPNCGHRNRLYERKDIEALKYHFKGIVDSYDEDGYPPEVDMAKFKENKSST